jgi:serine/threonine protein kinase
LKVLDPSPFITDYDKALKRFRREVTALRSLQHRSIVHYYEAGLTIDNKPYLVMPLIRGTDLRSAANAVSLAGAVSLFVEVLQGLAYAHHNDVIHRDLKPSNILVRSSDRQPLILDFGSAYILEQLDTKTLTTEAVGTIGYIPSEVLADPTLRSPLQDVYACGIMLYEALAGRRPDPANYLPLGTLNPAHAPLDPIVSHAIAGAKARLTSAGEFADQLSALK